MPGGHSRLPVRPFCQLPVAQQCKHAIIFTIYLRRQRRSDSERHAVAQRTGVLLNPIYLPGWMADEVRPKPIQRIQLRLWEEPAIGQDRIKSLDGVSLALHKPVAVRVPKSSRAQAQDSVVEHVEDVDTREAAAGVSGSSMFNDGENGFSVLDRFKLKLLEVEGSMFMHARVIMNQVAWLLSYCQGIRRSNFGALFDKRNAR